MCATTGIGSRFTCVHLPPGLAGHSVRPPCGLLGACGRQETLGCCHQEGVEAGLSARRVKKCAMQGPCCSAVPCRPSKRGAAAVSVAGNRQRRFFDRHAAGRRRAHDVSWARAPLPSASWLQGHARQRAPPLTPPPLLCSLHSMDGMGHAVVRARTRTVPTVFNTLCVAAKQQARPLGT